MNASRTNDSTDTLDGFLAASALLTGFSPVELQGTGLVQTYYGVLWGAAGSTAAAALIEQVLRVEACSGSNRDGELRQVFEDPQLGPPCQRLIALWYTGVWKALPNTWHAQYAGDLQDFDHVISPDSYRQGLQWPTIGSHPQGAKQPGFATWSFPPKPLFGAEG